MKRIGAPLGNRNAAGRREVCWPPVGEGWMRTDEAAKVWGVSARTVLDWAARGKVKRHRGGPLVWLVRR